MLTSRIVMGAGWSILIGMTYALSQTLPAKSSLEILGPPGGDVLSLAIDREDPLTLYAGTDDGAIFKSRDGAGSWTRLVPGIGKRGLVINELLLDPQDSQTIYAAAWQLMASGGGLFRSTDGGSTWKEILFDTADTSVRALAVPRSDSKILYVGTLRGVYRSLNGGESWEFLPESAYMVYGVESLAVDGKNPNLIFAGSRRMGYRSRDGGRRWFRIVEGMQADSDIFDLLMLDSHERRVLAAACTGVFFSQDDGMKWQHARLGKEKMKLRTLCLASDPQDKQRIYAGTTAGLFRSLDQGARWEFLYGDKVKVNAIAVDPSDSQILYLAAGDLGVLKSRDGGNHFQVVNQGLINRNVRAFVIDRRNPSHFILGVLFDNAAGGVFRSRDQGRSWMAFNDGIPPRARDVFALYQHPSNHHLFLAGVSSGLYVSGNDGATWTKIPSDQLPGKITVLAGARAGRQSRVLAGGPQGLFSSGDGIHWKALSWGGQPKAVYSIVFPSADPEKILVGSLGECLASEDGGRTWRISRLGLPSVTVQALSCPRGWNGPWFLGNRYGVYRSRDLGRIWEPVSRKLGAMDITALASFSGPALPGSTAWVDSGPGDGLSTAVVDSPDSMEDGASGGASDADQFWIVAADTLSGDLLVSSTAGETWRRMRLPGAGSRVWTLWPDRVRALRLYAGTASDGIYAIDLSRLAGNLSSH